ncbi:hypothetical protein C8J36_110130 [Rhizobium sp. PP-F2F-G48]|uniref:ATP-binding protein n=1 Tax=Rhizobium sp. PP-F2F-G48 TaxID=2135651 RepID=UPI001042B288|nr:ATP-binding protein [Rhizobium sp. PP-F2F-G48]TCM51123.1 hypothetical protein C8J36_110130 [Rhizobium sp. PP-F2F-G48]
MERAIHKDGKLGSSPASRGGAGTYIEGQLGAFYLLAMLKGNAAVGLPAARVSAIRFQGTEHGFALDDLIVHATGVAGEALLEIQSKRDITFAPRDPVYADVAVQIARTATTTVPEERHLLGVATQRTSRQISGAYQDVLKWARDSDTAEAFFKRIAAKGVGSEDKRTFVTTTRDHLVAAGVADNDETIWRILRRMLILEFDFEAAASVTRSYGVALARTALGDADAHRSEALWSKLIDLSIATGTTGGEIDPVTLRVKLAEGGFQLAGDRSYGPARERIAEAAQMTLAGIGTKVAGVTLPRLEAVAELDQALDNHRFVEIRGAPGVGKSWALRNLADRIAQHSPVIVLDPVGTPAGGWIAFANAFGIPGTAASFLTDYAASGGATLFIDGLDMFVDAASRRTVSELLLAAQAISEFRVVATSRTIANIDAEPWLDDDLIIAFGGIHSVRVETLSDAEVEALIEQAPELRALLDPSHPAAPLARNLYRLSRLLKMPSATEVRTEAALAQLWWQSADGAGQSEVRATQRILADLAARALKGETGIDLQADSGARTHLLEALTLKEVRRDRLAFYHDVLRDWAIGNWIAEDHTRLSGLNLSVPVSSWLARGIEFAGRIMLESSSGSSGWTALLVQLSPKSAHGSWRRQAMLALVRSEAGFELLERSTATLLDDDATLFSELVTTVVAVETVATVDVVTMPEGAKVELSRSHRTNVTGSALWLLQWVLNHTAEIPLSAIGSVVKLVEVQIMVLKYLPMIAKSAVEMLFGWLRQLDLREAAVTIPGVTLGDRAASDGRQRMIGNLRAVALLLGDRAPDQLKAYLTEVTAENDHYKIKEIRLFSQAIASAAPAELAALILGSLVEKRDRRRGSRDTLHGAFTFSDTDYLPPSPAQPPFLPLLEAEPEEGLKLIRTLVREVVEYNAMSRDPGDNGFTVVLDGKPRFFPWATSFFWSRGQINEYAAASGLMALEAWSQNRLDDGDPVEAVLADILGPEESCAAYLLIAIDVLLSHFDVGRDALAPFLANPELLAADFQRSTRDQTNFGSMAFGLAQEPVGKTRLEDLNSRPSRKVSLINAVPYYLRDDPIGNALREQLSAAVEKLEPFDVHSSWVDPRLIARVVRNMLDLGNWIEREDGNSAYQPPPDEAAHVAQMSERHGVRVPSINLESCISLALEGGEQASAETARMAVEYAEGGLPDDSDTDHLKSRSTRLISTALLVARDGDDALFEQHEDWVRQVIYLGLAEESDRLGGSSDTLRYNRPAISMLALIHLWVRKREAADRDALIRLTTRRDRIAAPAFSAGLNAILNVEPDLLKAAMRAAFASMTWRWQGYRDGTESEHEAFENARAEEIEVAIGAEIGWLNGDLEPAWPKWPKEHPHLRRALVLRTRRPESVMPEEFDTDTSLVDSSTEKPSIIHVDSRAAAQWLAMVETGPKSVVPWRQEVTSAYLDWTSRMNGLGMPVEAEIDGKPMEWNAQFYILFAERLLDAEQGRFDQGLRMVTGLPDKSFCDVAPSVIQAADALYFNDPARPAARPVALRSALTGRVMKLRRWEHASDPASPRVDTETAGVVAKVLFNNHNPFSITASYLPPLLFDRVDPLLDTVRPLMAGGPTSFVALCTMNLLLVAPQPRHINFLLNAVETWFSRTQAVGFWIATGIGGQVVKWFKAVITEEPGLLLPEHPYRDRIDRVLGYIVGVGLAEAHELELQVEERAQAVRLAE